MILTYFKLFIDVNLKSMKSELNCYVNRRKGIFEIELNSFENTSYKFLRSIDANEFDSHLDISEEL